MQTRGRVRGDREHQVVELHILGLPILFIGDVANLRVLLVALEHKRPGAHRFLVDVLRLAFFEQLSRIFGRLHRGKAHGQVLHKRGIDIVQAETHGVLVEFVDAFDRGVQTHVGEVRRLGRVSFAEWALGVQKPVEGEQHIIRVEVTGRGEVLGGVELDAIAQMEGVGQAVFGDIPTGCQARFDFGAATLELGQAVEHGFGGGIKVGAAGVLAGVEAGGAGFGAVDQGAGGVSHGHTGQEAGGE